jgi:RHS repeat-associated protein
MDVAGRYVRGIALFVVWLWAGAAMAQVQRTFVNLGFELPSAAPSTCAFQVSETLVPGWTTNHPSQSGTGCGPNVAQTPGPLIEIWRSGFSSVSARSGSQFAELNAEAASRIFQNVCLANGELVGWRFSHRGRQSTTTDDVTEFRVGSTPNTHRVVRAGTQSDGGGGVQTCYGTTAAGDGGVRSNSCTTAVASNGKTGNRLTQVQHIGPVGSETGSATTAYVYDANDHLTTETTTLSGNVPVPGATAGQTSYIYDAAGNTTRKASPTETLEYRYDDANRLAELETLAGEVTRYTYTHDGIRLSQTANATSATTTTHYLIDPNQPYAQIIEEAEQIGTTAPTLKALYAVGDDRIRRYTPAVAGSGGNPGVSAGLRYYHADGLGSTRLLTDDTGAVTDHTTLEAFGEIDTAASLQTSDNSFLYTGEQLDPNSGLYYLRARYMDPGFGRFTQQDAWTGNGYLPATLNKYTYGDADGVNKRDPSGHMALADVSISVNTQGGGRAVSTTASRASLRAVSKAKIFNIYTAFQMGAWLSGLGPHWFMVSEGPTGNYRFDFGPQGMVKSFVSFTGSLQMTRYYKLPALARKTRLVARFNYFQWLSWTSIVMGMNRANIEYEIGTRSSIDGVAPDYCLFGKNCRNIQDIWVMEAIIIAKGLERVGK